MRWAYPELLRSYFSLRAEVGLWYVTVRAIVLLRVVGAEAASAAGERSAIDPPELLAATGAVVGSVRNRSCFICYFSM